MAIYFSRKSNRASSCSARKRSQSPCPSVWSFLSIWRTVLAGPGLSSDSEIPVLISCCANTSVSRLRCFVSSPNPEYTNIFFFKKKKFQLCDLGRTPPPEESFGTQLPKGVAKPRDATGGRHPAGLLTPREGPRRPARRKRGTGALITGPESLRLRAPGSQSQEQIVS